MYNKENAPCVVAQQGLNRINFKTYTVTNTLPRQSNNDNREQRRQDMAWSEKRIPIDRANIKKRFARLLSLETVQDKERQLEGKDFVAGYEMPFSNARLEMHIDAKGRREAARNWWRDKKIPELCFEVLNNGRSTGFCISDENEKTDALMFSFENMGDNFLAPYQLARLVLQHALASGEFEPKENKSGSGAHCVYIPVDKFLFLSCLIMCDDGKGNIPLPTLKGLMIRFIRYWAAWFGGDYNAVLRCIENALNGDAANDNAPEQQAG